jgi:hypothetical protein
MKYRLKPVEVDFAVRTTNLHFQVDERSDLPVVIDTQTRAAIISTDIAEASVYQTAEITFTFLAKLEFTMMNFSEYNYENYEIIGEDPIDIGFYHVLNSPWNKDDFDPLKRFNLVHFLLIGYDSYLELLANKNFTTKILH